MGLMDLMGKSTMFDSQFGTHHQITSTDFVGQTGHKPFFCMSNSWGPGRSMVPDSNIRIGAWNLDGPQSLDLSHLGNASGLKFDQEVEIGRKSGVVSSQCVWL